ncbi:tRNA1Val (adenine37-N6)-methyltransferase [Pseudobutyrivibrio sp. 49]|uniref:tRNA1(Val) (adenine(37)-N6)-methyltransferase n=1 Tax=Pseudobutyrivibrio sp. 49 TaxID=1855344 RepID=UPI00088840AE|nr:tRNA1(Val) (adenine(37)-N6)-methyltransferase [Pseudobutyrivibrio sp. 49]SDH69411.1 tRNA1Val (adenine37-N6)-methyltransferase [Pseudobutyrivibrio sp. 49]
MENLVRDDERVDDLQINGYKIIQHPDKFCFGMDAVLLSSFAKVKEGEKALDLGTGTGILPILLEAKTDGEHFTGLEIQPESAEMANRSVLLNGLSDKIDIIEGDIKETSNIFGKSTMNVVTSNPPYMTNHHGLKNPNDAKAIARHELLCSLEDVISQTSAVLKQMGRCYFVHRPFRLVEIITLMRQYKLEPKRMRLVYPFVDKEPNMVLIEGVKGGGPQLTVESPLIVYDAPGQYTKEIYDIYGMIMEK